MKSIETIREGGATVTVTIRTGLSGTSGSWRCECGTGDDGEEATAGGRKAGRTAVDTVALKQAAHTHALECDGTWTLAH